jgi:hypothetical protein
MKKVSTLILGSLLALVVSASARQPQVILHTSNNYEVRIDGNYYNGNSAVISNLSQGTHTVQVYQVKAGSGIFGIGKKRVQVSSSQFNLRNNDVRIDVNQYGHANIYENGNVNGQGRNNNGNWNNNNRGDDRNGDYNNNDHSNGRGHKYGHYKKNKKNKERDNENKHDDDNNRRGNDDND